MYVYVCTCTSQTKTLPTSPAPCIHTYMRRGYLSKTKWHMNLLLSAWWQLLLYLKPQWRQLTIISSVKIWHLTWVLRNFYEIYTHIHIHCDSSLNTWVLLECTTLEKQVDSNHIRAPWHPVCSVRQWSVTEQLQRRLGAAQGRPAPSLLNCFSSLDPHGITETPR